MPEPTEATPASGNEPYGQVLLEAVRGLGTERLLKYGIAAAILLIGVPVATGAILGVTGALIALGIVAAVVVLAGAGWLYQKTQELRSRERQRDRERQGAERTTIIETTAHATGAKAKRTNIGGVEGAPPTGAKARTHAEADHGEFEDANIGGVNFRHSRETKEK